MSSSRAATERALLELPAHHRAFGKVGEIGFERNHIGAAERRRRAFERVADAPADPLRKRDHALGAREIARVRGGRADQARNLLAVRKLAAVAPAIEMAGFTSAGAAETLMREEIRAFLNRLLKCCLRRLRRRG